MSTTNDATFGRRGASKPIPTQSFGHTPNPKLDPDNSLEEPRNSLVEFFYRVFVWLPNEQSPGIVAVCLALIRMATLPLIAMIAPFVVVAAAWHHTAMPNWAPSATAFYVFFCISFVQELCRYSFVRNSETPARSVTIFGIVASILIVAAFHKSPYTLAWMIGVQLIESAIMLATVRYRSYRYLIVAALIFGGTLAGSLLPMIPTILSKARPFLFSASQPKLNASPNNSDSALPKPSPLQIGGMDAWEKLYPDADVITNDVMRMPFHHVVQWRSLYKTKATPEQLDAFYRSLAAQVGFYEEASSPTYHCYMLHGTDSAFDYSIMPDGTVMFEAAVSDPSGA